MSVGRVWATARLDLAHNLRRPLFWIFVVLLGLVAWGFSSGDMRIQSGDSTVGGTKAFITSEFAIAQMLSVFVLLLYAFFIAVGAGMTVLRDEELKVGAKIRTESLKDHASWGFFYEMLSRTKRQIIAITPNINTP